MKKIPDMPNEIKDAIDNSKLYIFVGAGVSRLYGYPSWEEMGKHLIDFAVNKKAITRSEQSILLNGNFTSMQLVTIAFDRIEKKLGIETAKEQIKKELALDKQKQKNFSEKVEIISSYLSRYKSIILTTNADLSLDNSESFKGKNIIDNFKKWDRDENFVSIFHLHGSINEFDSLVFTSEQYATAYMAESSFGQNLMQIFGGDKTILFIGYGVSEFELIRYFLKTNVTPEKPSMFMLSGYLDKDKLRYDFDKEYFKTLGIEVLFYSIEKNGYDALIDVLKRWDKTLNTETFVSDHFDKTIKKAFSEKPNTKSIKEIKSYF